MEKFGLGSDPHDLSSKKCVRMEAAEHHRLLSSTLYMAKPSTANTVAPTLALSQKVEFLRSAGLTCLCSRRRRHTQRETSGVRPEGTGPDLSERVWNVKIQNQADDVIGIKQKRYENMKARQRWSLDKVKKKRNEREKCRISFDRISKQKAENLLSVKVINVAPAKCKSLQGRRWKWSGTNTTDKQPGLGFSKETQKDSDKTRTLRKKNKENLGE